MPLYENEICPVCGKAFTAQDDVVICPVCGTPHHRECYDSLGRCVNKEKHASGYEYSPAAASDSRSDSDGSAQESKMQGEYYTPDDGRDDTKAETKTHCVSCGAQIEKDAPFCSKCGQKQPSPDYSSFTPPSFAQYADEYTKKVQEENGNSGDIDGRSVQDVSAAVRTNQKRFIPRFLKKSKVSWNWGAFFFGPFYLLFRKIYKEGIIFLALRLIVSLFAQGAYAQEYADFYNFISQHMNALSDNPSEELLNQLTPLYEKLLPMFIIIFAANLVINIVIALFADNMYKGKVFHIIDKVNGELEQGGELEQAIPFMSDASMSQKDMKTLYLGKLGGTSVITPLLGYLALDLISSLISKL